MTKIILKFNGAIIKEHPFAKDEISIGRRPDNDIVIDNPAVSGHHARIVRSAEGYVLEDLNSTNGTFLQDRKVMKATLKNGDQVGVAKHVLQFMSEGETAAPRPLPPHTSDATVVMAPAPAAAPGAKPATSAMGGLRVIEGETTATQFSLAGLTTYIGKSSEANIRLRGFFAPDLAACIARQPDGYYLKTLKEKAVKLNGNPLSAAEPAMLKEGDVIEVGHLKLVYYLQGANDPISG